MIEQHWTTRGRWNDETQQWIEADAHERAHAEPIITLPYKEYAELKAALSTARTDCATLAGEVPRCWELAQVGYNPKEDFLCGQCADVIDDRSAAVVEAMDRYGNG